MTLVNGSAANTVDAGDRGMAYGDGLFETIAIVNGRPQHWEKHLTRLRHGAGCLNIHAPPDETWRSDWQILAQGCPRQAVLKLLLTRGSGGRGYLPAPTLTPTRISRVFELPIWPKTAAEQGVSIRICATRLARNPRLAGIKHLNRLEQVLASAELASFDAIDGLMLDTHGLVIESTRSNVFLVVDDTLVTPTLEHCGIAGIMREVILEACHEVGLRVMEQVVDLESLGRCSEMFVCNSLIGIWPIRQVVGAIPELPVGSVTRGLQSRLRQLELLP